MCPLLSSYSVRTPIPIKMSLDDDPNSEIAEVEKRSVPSVYAGAVCGRDMGLIFISDGCRPHYYVSSLVGPREDYLQWEDFFMATAYLAAMRSKDPVTQVGACIVDKENRIVGVGYNGMPSGCSDHAFPWNKKAANNKFLYVCHAEMNAILNKNSADVRGCRIYVGLFPCHECAKIIIQSGIKEVVYISDKNRHKVENMAAKKMFDAAKVTYRKFCPNKTSIVINFDSIEI